MRETAVRRIEVFANLSIIAAALLVCAILGRNLVTGAADGTRAPRKVAGLAPPAGAKLSLPGVVWAGADRTVVLVLSTTCHFCSEGVPFYQKVLKRAAERGNIRLIAVLPQGVEEGRKYLNGLGLSLDQVVQAKMSSIGARGTPTVIVVDSKGVVRNTWMGRILPEKESEILSQID
jgi:hypothetical protein